MSFLDFEELLPGPKDRRVTRRWLVHAKSGHLLGAIGWYSGWRRYVYWAQAGTIYEELCLREIAAFCEAHTRERKAQCHSAAIAATTTTPLSATAPT